MKKTLLSAVLLLLVLALLLGGCANHGKTLITAGKNKISVNVYQLYLARMKGALSLGGASVYDANYWAQFLSLDQKQTYKDYYTQNVLDGLRLIAAAMYLYDEEKLSLPKETEDAIDAEIEALIQEIGDGSKTALNSVLASYGANVTVLRDAYILEAKLEQLKAHLYGANGELISPTAKEEYYKMSYYRGYQMQLANFYYRHDMEDDEKTSVYYQTKTASDGTVTLLEKIAYDTKNGVATDEKDDYGDTVYRVKNEDGSLGGIAYDKENGGIKYEFDENGEYIVDYYSNEQMEERRELLKSIAKECVNNEELFLKYADTFSDSKEFNKNFAPNGMYFTVGGYLGGDVLQTFSDELVKLEIGEIAEVTYSMDDKTYDCLLMRVNLDGEAWNVEENATWFKTLPSLAMEYMLQERLKNYMQYVTVNEALAASVDITMVDPTNYY